MGKSIWDQFTNQYALSKTLRFELKPTVKTLENMRDNFRYDKSLQTFLADQKIEDAYQSLKPVFDFLHEKFINECLESKKTSEFDFSPYLDKYRSKKETTPNEIEKIEKLLRSKFSELFNITADIWKIKAGKNEKGKDLLTDKGFNILTHNSILEYIEKNIEMFASIKPAEEIIKKLNVFKGFFTYFTGFNQNRENYYETAKETATSVAYRVVNENLPKFCDNILFFEGRQEEYLTAYDYLNSNNINLVNKEEKKLAPINGDIFQINNFNKCFSQKQIELYNEQIGNANFIINLYNQAQKGNSEYKKLSLFKNLYKQIGCGEKKSLFFTLNCDTRAQSEKLHKENKESHSVEEIIGLASEAGKKYFCGLGSDSIINTVPELINYLKNREDYRGIYWTKSAINSISNKYFANWQSLLEVIKSNKLIASYNNKREEQIKVNDAVELNELFDIINRVENWRQEGVFFKENLTKMLSKSDENKEENEKRAKRREIIVDSKTASEALLLMIFGDILENINKFTSKLSKILEITDYKTEKNISEIKQWMDYALTINQIIKYFSVKENKIKSNPLDATLSQALDILLRSDDAQWFKWYDALRNYLTKKPKDNAKENKLKLNFENSTLAGGWDVNKEPDNSCVILTDFEGKQYLAIIAKQEGNKGNNKLFVKNSNNPLYKTESDGNWCKVEYKLLPGPNKMLPKCLIPKSDRFKYGADDKILKIYDEGSFKKSEPAFSKKSLHKIIGFYKNALNKYDSWNCFNFVFRPTLEYQDISQFYSDVEIQGYKLDLLKVNKNIIDEWVIDGKIYLFEIKNQDSNMGKIDNHKNNLHTIYWRALFENIENRPKLNGQAEIFYRKAIPVKSLEKIKDKKGKERIKNYRFSQEKFLFHVPITLNFCLKNERINNLINEEFIINDNIHFLGIDRGEKQLAYYSLINGEGEIIVQGSFNEINGQNYNEKLSEIEKERMDARKNWRTISTIKELKEGYISQVVRKVADLAIKHNAFIVLEDLNTGFKRGRQKIEKSVYQKFELALAKKLNFLVDKDAKYGDTGSVTKALQLTPPVNNYGDIENRKQVGIMLYTRANYTSQTDPITGWRRSIYLKPGSEESIKKQIIDNFTDIIFDEKSKNYVFIYTDKNTGTKWNLYSGKDGESLDRFRGRRGKDKNEWIVGKQDTMKILDGIFADFDKERSLLSQIVDENKELKKISERTAWESLRFAIDLIQQIRNTGVNKEDNDFILSPVRDRQGNHFDSRKATENQPNSGDANGAFNIARKGVIMAEHIKRGYSPFVCDAEWDAWLAGRGVWEKWLKNNKELVLYKNKK